MVRRARKYCRCSSKAGQKRAAAAALPKPTDALRDEYAHNGLDARGLEAAGQLRLVEERHPGLRAEALREALAAYAGSGRTVWASFDWVEQVGLEAALREQQGLATLVDTGPLVVKTAVL